MSPGANHASQEKLNWGKAIASNTPLSQARPGRNLSDEIHDLKMAPTFLVRNQSFANSIQQWTTKSSFQDRWNSAINTNATTARRSFVSAGRLAVSFVDVPGNWAQAKATEACWNATSPRMPPPAFSSYRPPQAEPFRKTSVSAGYEEQESSAISASAAPRVDAT